MNIIFVVQNQLHKFNDMVYFIILLASIGMIFIPAGEAYVARQRQKKNKKYLDPLYYRKAQITIRVIGIAICLIAFLLLHFVWDKTTF